MPAKKTTSKKTKTSKKASTGAKKTSPAVSTADVLVIVESPTKAKTLSKILDKTYQIEASMGHIRDLPKSGLGVDVEHDFLPTYEITQKGESVARKLKSLAKSAHTIILATDPDREGEAIAWHLHHILSSVGVKHTFYRVTFHELTKDAVLEAFNHKGELNIDLVDAQQARRVLDRLVGYKLSPLLWKKVRYGLSAGRVQSVAVRLIVERERERDAFKPEEYWSAHATLSAISDKNRTLVAEVLRHNDKKLEIGSEKAAHKVRDALKTAKFHISDIKVGERSKNPYAPLKTSTLQQTMANVFGMSAKKTMDAAQKLFEHGLITYHRTDSLNLSPQFISSARHFAEGKFGKNYLPEKPVFFKTKSKNAQEAHEAVRPTDINLLPMALKKTVTEEQRRVYSIIWKRSLECQMLPAVYDSKSVTILTDNSYELRSSGSTIKFDGWLAVSKFLNLNIDDEDVNTLDEFDVGEGLNINEIKLNQHFTQPPARYSDASLIKKLEELEIGRPSTYAPTLQTITARGYVEREGRYFKPKDVAYVVNDLLVAHFPHVVDFNFTAEMEEHFDEISRGEKEWVPVIKDFYEPFEKIVLEKDKTLSKHDITNLGETDEKCPECGKPLVIKLGKYGKFLSCSGYPDCEYARPMEEDLASSEDFGKCDECEDGVYVLKQGRYGKFLACSNYPKCKGTKPYLEKIGMSCPKCGKGDVIVKKAKFRSFFGCSRYPDCDYASWKNPLGGKKASDNASIESISSEVLAPKNKEEITKLV